MAIILNVEHYDDGIKLESFTEKHFKYLTKSHFYKLVRTGQIRVNGGRAKASDRLKTDDEVRFPPFIYEYKTESGIHQKSPDNVKKNPRKKADENVVQKKLRTVKDGIIFEDENMFAINKPSGLSSQGGSKTAISLDDLVNMLDETSSDGVRKIRLVHRLDKETSGVMIFAKNLVTARSLAENFKNRSIRKTYLAMCYGIFKDKFGVIRNEIIDDEKRLPAVTNYAILGEYKNLFSLVELRPETGRKHQLRIHLSGIGHAIIGDTKHCTRKQLNALNVALESIGGSSCKKTMDGLYLHAFHIGWQDSATERQYNIDAPVNGNFLAALEKFFDAKVWNKYI